MSHRPLPGPRAFGPVARARRRVSSPLPPRAARRRPGPLPAGPLTVPISTIDWLVSRESPAARYVALRDLLGRPAKDPEMKRARQALPRDPWTRDMLEALRRRTLPGTSAAELSRRYDGGLWLTLFLVETGCDATFPVVRHAGNLLFAAWEKAFVELSRREDAAVDLRVFTPLCRALALMGHAGDPRLLSAAGYVARAALLGRGVTAKSLLLFATVPEEQRAPSVRRAVELLRARALEAEIPPPFLRSGFPTGDESDLAELLWALALTTPEGAVSAREGPLARGLALLLARADHRGRWLLEHPLAGGLPVPLERTGEMSRWVTLRALMAVRHFLGLSIEGAQAVPRPAKP
ncbi:MAG: hypothetical protein ACM3JH_10820 [Acidithiobacillales bacterium]